ncbi:hypothetical protein [Gottfriedia solisilvae]|uniref:hypothetical protein n=1 Tax=Gottfriedia solisilvae TaxID=1516104 RepID=UPI003D2F48BE
MILLIQQFIVHSGSGPILGHDRNENVCYVWNISKNYIEEVSLFDAINRKKMPMSKFIKKGHFVDAMKGL